MSGGNSLDINNIMMSEHQTAVEISNKWLAWDAARIPWKKSVEETTRYVYATSTRDTTNVVNPWSHSTHIPKITQISDNLKANYFSGLFPHNDWLKFEGEDRESVTLQKRQMVESYLKTKHRLYGFRNVVGQLLDDWVLTGNAFAMVTYENQTSINPETDLPESAYLGPKTYRISPHDIVFNPLATSFEQSPKIIRSIKTLGEIQRDIEENPELQHEEGIFQKVLGLRGNLHSGGQEEVQKYMSLPFEGFGTFGQYLDSGYVEILDFYGDIYDKEEGKLYKNHVITVVDRKWVLRREPLNTWTGRPHIYHVGWRERPENLWAMGPLDNLVGLQYRINHLENAKADAFDQMISPDIVYKGDVQEYPGEFGSVIYEVNEQGDVQYLSPDTTVLNADFQIQAYEDRMELYAGAPREAMGIRTPGEKTAFEVQSLQNAAGRIFQSKMTHFEVNMLEKLVNAEIEVARRNLMEADLIKIVDTDTGVQEFLTITKDDITANGKLVPIGARHFARQAQLSQEMSQLQQMIAMDPEVLNHFPSIRIAEMWEELLGFDKFKLLEPNGRIYERVETAQLEQIAAQQLQEDQVMAQQMAAGEEV